MTGFFETLIVGAGHGGVSLVAQLAKSGYQGSLGILEADRELPYERPPLTKRYLLGEVSSEEIVLRKAEYWSDSHAQLLSSTRVVDVDTKSSCVVTEAGEQIGYGSLVWAAGGGARVLDVPGGDDPHVVTIRTRHDVDKVRRVLAEPGRVCIVGGGYVGLEAAASLTKLGHEVTVVEVEQRLLSRVAGSDIADHFHELHSAHGVTFKLGATVSEFAKQDGCAIAVRLADGTSLPADLVIVGIGISPSVGPLVSADAEVTDGLVVDQFCRTSLPNVYAIGDVASFESRFADGSRVRLESVQNAVEHAKVVASHIVGGPAFEPTVPWFWSQQYDVRLQTAGLFRGYDRSVSRRPDSSSLTVGYFREDRLIGVDCVNRPHDFAAGKQIISARVPVDLDRFARVDTDLRELLN